jgi:hypothetical protein
MTFWPLSFLRVPLRSTLRPIRLVYSTMPVSVSRVIGLFIQSFPTDSEHHETTASHHAPHAPTRRRTFPLDLQRAMRRHGGRLHLHERVFTGGRPILHRLLPKRSYRRQVLLEESVQRARELVRVD